MSIASLIPSEIVGCTKSISLKVAELSDYSGISQRTLRTLLNNSVNPIPFYRVGAAGRIVRIKKSEFDLWMNSQRAEQREGIDEIIDGLLKGE